MFQRFCQAIVFFVFSLVVLTGTAVYTSAEAAPRYNSRDAALIIDASTGKVIYQRNAGKTRYPASLTKLMTLYLAFEALETGKLHMNKMVTVSAHAAAQPASKLWLRKGQQISVRDLIMSLVVKSANDAAVVLAEAIGGTEARFAQMMTQKARQLGMMHTAYRNASGLHNPGQKTTAYDLARLAMALHRDHRQYYPLFSKTRFQYAGHVITGHNRVTQNYSGADGLKTGYVAASGFNLATSARRGSHRLIGVVLGGATAQQRDREMVRLLDAGFKQLGSRNGAVFETASAIRTMPVSRHASRAAAVPAPKPVRSTAAAPSVRSAAATPAFKPAAFASRFEVSNRRKAQQYASTNSFAAAPHRLSQDVPYPMLKPAAE